MYSLSSSFHAVQRVVSIGLQKVKLCQTEFKQEVMTDSDMQFLTSFAKVMKPIMLAMNFLQSDTTIYLVHLIPTIMGTKSKLEHPTDRIVDPLVKALSDGIDRRFRA